MGWGWGGRELVTGSGTHLRKSLERIGELGQGDPFSRQADLHTWEDGLAGRAEEVADT